MEEVRMADFKENSLVVKSNQIVSAIFPKSLTPSEMDLLSVAFTSIKKEDTDFGVVRVRVQDLIRLYGLENSKSAYEQVYAVSRRLLSRVVEIEDAEKRRLVQFQILSMADYNIGGGYVDIKFHEMLKPYLLDIKRRYTKYQLRYSLSLDSFYAKRIYELLVQYRRTRGEDGVWTRDFSVLELRSLLGIPKKEYERFSNFRARVLNISISQINARTDITVNCEEIKVGRRVDILKFSAFDKADMPEPYEPATDPTASKDYARLVAYGVEEATARRLVTDYPADVVAYNLDRLESALKSPRGEKIQNPAGWLVAGIEAGRGEQLNLLKTPEAGTPVHESKEDEAKYKLRRKDELKAILLPVREAYKKYLRTTLEGFIFGLSDEEQETHKDGFAKYMRGKYGPNIVGAPSFALAQFEKDGWLNSVVILYAVDYFVTHGLAIIEKIEFATKKGVNDYEVLSGELAELERGLKNEGPR